LVPAQIERKSIKILAQNENGKPICHCEAKGRSNLPLNSEQNLRQPPPGLVTDFAFARW